MAKIMPSWFLAKRGWIDWNKWVVDLFISCMPVLKDATPEVFEEVITYTMETQLWAKRRLDMIERINGHVQQGMRCISRPACGSQLWPVCCTDRGQRTGNGDQV